VFSQTGIASQPKQPEEELDPKAEETMKDKTEIMSFLFVIKVEISLNAQFLP